MHAVMAAIRTELGGVEAYVKAHTSLTDSDLERIRNNLLEA